MRLKISCLFFNSIFIFNLFGASDEMNFDLEEKILYDISERVNLGYNYSSIACLLFPQKTSYLFINSESSIHDLYEIGSITKFFTAHLCLILNEKGIIQLDEPVRYQIQKIFPNSHISLHNKTLYQLLTHTSGLVDPRTKGYFNESTGNTIPIVDYTVSDIDHFLSQQHLPSFATNPIYSNLGYILVGSILEEVTGKSYFHLLKEHILDPLQMYETFIEMPVNYTYKKAIGHCQGVVASYWRTKHFPAFASIISSIHDLSIYFRHIIFSKCDNPRIFNFLLEVPFKINELEVSFGLGWSCDQRYNGKINVVTGRTLGFSSFVGWDMDRDYLIVLLADSDTVGNMPYRWLNCQFPMDNLNGTAFIENIMIGKLNGKYQLVDDEKSFVLEANKKNICLNYSGELPTILWYNNEGKFFTKQLYDSQPSFFIFREEEGVINMYEMLDEEIRLVARKLE